MVSRRKNYNDLCEETKKNESVKNIEMIKDDPIFTFF